MGKIATILAEDHWWLLLITYASETETVRKCKNFVQGCKQVPLDSEANIWSKSRYELEKKKQFCKTAEVNENCRDDFS